MVVFLPDYFPTRNSDTNFDQTLAAVAQYEHFLEDSAKAQAIAKLGYDKLANSDMVDANKISAIGFCFGGAMTLNLARSGAKLLAGVSLHGEYPHLDLKVGKFGATGTYNTQHFVEMVGYVDPFIPQASRDSWVAELNSYTANTDKTFDFIVYGTSVHAFSIHYSETFLHVLALVLREFKGMKGAKVVEGGIPGVVRYEQAIADRSFARIDQLFTQLGMFSESSGGGEKPGPASSLMIMADNACIKLGAKSDVTICRVGPKELRVSGDLKVNGVSLMAFIEKAEKFMKEYKH
jgi:dienelactone hydrolase